MHRIELLCPEHDRTQFGSGVEALDRYFQQQVTQDVRRRVTACFVAVSTAPLISGFYTLASTSIVLTDLPASTGKKLPRYPSVPAIRMGRLAVDQRFKGKGLGAALIADALERACRAEIAAFALVVDAKDEAASDFYAHHGFTPFTSMPLAMFLPLAAVKTLT